VQGPSALQIELAEARALLHEVEEDLVHRLLITAFGERIEGALALKPWDTAHSRRIREIGSNSHFAASVVMFMDTLAVGIAGLDDDRLGWRLVTF